VVEAVICEPLAAGGTLRRVARAADVLRALAATSILALVSMHAPDAFAAANYEGQTLTAPNFLHQDLSGANFKNAIIVGGVFVRANLNGAHFDNATFRAVPGHPTQTTDFTEAVLDNATFTNATFATPTYFTYASLTCADFSNTILNNGNAVFGDEPLNYKVLQNCRTKFQFAKMNCEFIDDWHAFDLTSADISACLTNLAGRNFSGAIMDNVHFDNAIMDGAQFVNASLMQTSMTYVSLQCLGKICVDMTGAHLQGAVLNNANLTGATLYGALLSNDTAHNVEASAKLRNAHLKGVNLATATLSGADLTSANFYGERPKLRRCITTGASDSGFTTLGCASAAGATIDGTIFTDAYLYAVDFSGATITGANFNDAVLVAADFASANIGPSISSGAATEFVGAYMQGTNLDAAAQVMQVDLSDAYFDFRALGNIVDINLDGHSHNAFTCGNPSTCTQVPTGQDVCVYNDYAITTVPPQAPMMVCPDKEEKPCGDPANPQFTPNWRGTLTLDNPPIPGPPIGWYHDPPTFGTKTPLQDMCNGRGDLNGAVFNW
jgi:uncharacterized protein YjbI with pentapeptide repeats